MISFSETYHEYDLVEETEFYQHFYNPKMPSIYSCNVLKFKRNPTLEEYIVAENKLMEFQQIMNQDYIFLYTVENEPFSKEVEHYLLSKNYSIASEELLSIDPKDFFFKHSNEEVTVVLVQSNSQLKDYLNFMYQLNLKNGISFAHKKQVFYLNRFHSTKIQQISAYLNGKVVGTANIILSVPFIEIDHFEVALTSQNKGIGTEIQKFIMSLTKDKKVILVVDKGTDANNMYYRQHYQFSGYQMSAFKKFTPSLLLNIPHTHSSSNSTS
ncbi:hypothetical protein SAMN05878443_1797 [Carnobacterium alterfunditum]|uniref:N-acetyltransferase domain-containing protein n=1 Tax=Carnobacterium alterfunditum TaxID=28230 RepID=A0A1N6HDT2_9LACT|nr:GNAT family N-acetyltransferase [Carnobacterium alterfunditum]SIO17952.1 hypothetical protein SAMN05878443_1797 [Carnobacterium alterfunditum]